MMAEYARIHAGAVAELVDLDSAAHAAWVAAGNPKAEAYRPVVDDPVPEFNPDTHTIDPSLVVEPARVRRAWAVRPKTADELRKVWTSFEFLQRFTTTERAEVRSRSASDPILADFLMLCTAAQEIVSDDPVTVQAMNYLVAVGVLTESRKDQILS